MGDYAADYYNIRDQDRKAEALRQRQLQDQQTLTRLENRTDYAVQLGVVGTRGQALQRSPVPDIQRLPVGEQIVRNPSLLKKAIAPTPMPAVPQPRAIGNQHYTQKIQKSPLKNTPSILYAGGMPTGLPVKKWPTSFKKAFHKPTTDEMVLKGLQNLDNMSNKLLGKPRR
jgi:hypothetical protein